MCTTCNKRLAKPLIELRDGKIQLSEFISKHLSVKCPAMLALEHLTPSGSEFWEDVSRCSTFARDRISNAQKMAIRFAKERNAAEALLKQARETISNMLSMLFDFLFFRKWAEGFRNECERRARLHETLNREKAGTYNYMVGQFDEVLYPEKFRTSYNPHCPICHGLLNCPGSAASCTGPHDVSKSNPNEIPTAEVGVKEKSDEG